MKVCRKFFLIRKSFCAFSRKVEQFHHFGMAKKREVNYFKEISSDEELEKFLDQKGLVGKVTAKERAKEFLDFFVPLDDLAEFRDVA